MLYKKSKYNIIKDDYIYNLLKKQYIQVNKPFLEYLNKTNEFNEEEVPEYILNKLKEYNIVTSIDELNQIDYQYNSLKYNRAKAAYIIYPTLSCNFSCNYCFESTKKGSLDLKKTKYLKNFLLNQIEKLDEINIRWSGGEPLLAWDRIKEISEIFINRKSNLMFTSSMATNGYLLNESIAQDMLIYNFKWLQITVDGTEEEHNKIRFTNNDRKTYAKVINGIKIASKYLKIRIRFNVNNTNKDKFAEFLNDLKRFDVNNENIEIYVKPIQLKQGCSYNEDLITEEAFFMKELGYVEIAEKKGFKYSLHPNFKSGIRCLYHHIDSFVIDPELNLYKCALQVGMKDQKVGII